MGRDTTHEIRHHSRSSQLGQKASFILIFISDRQDQLDCPSIHKRLGAFLQGLLWFKHKASSLMKRLLSDILWPRLCRRQGLMLIMA